MGKQRITVCLPPVDPDGLRQAIGQVMAPFWYDREDRPHPDWVGEWSHWFVSGAGCLFDVLSGHEDDPRLVRYDDWTDSPDDLPPSRCHGGPRGVLDLGTPRTVEARRAAGTWTAYHAREAAVAAVLTTPALLTLDGRWVEGSGPDYERMFSAYLDGLPGDTMVVRVLYHS